MEKIRFLNLCIVEFGRHFKMSPHMSFGYLNTYGGLAFLDKCYAAEHLVSLDEIIDDLVTYCKSHGGTLE